MTPSVQVLDPAAAEERARDVVVRVVEARIHPSPDLTVSEWADRRRVIPEGTSPEPGRWRTSRVPYLREIMDAVSEDDVEEVVAMLASQVAKTEFLLNVAGYFIDLDPSPILVLVPSETFGKTWSKDRLQPMLDATPTLRGTVSEAKSRDSENTILHKKFQGGTITIVGTHSATNLSSRPIRVVLGDEVDRFSESAGDEGNPFALARVRTRNFWNRKLIRVSSPTVKGFSQIEKAYEHSSKAKYHVPCPSCEDYHVLEWRNIEWDDNDSSTARWRCPSCEEAVYEGSKPWMLARGKWVHEEPDRRRRRGFHLSALYSPWVSWSSLVEEWLDAQGSQEELKAFVNTALAETWEEDAEQIDPTALEGRREPYGDPDEPTVPKGAAILTAAVDVQGDRLELLVLGWGAGEESWVVEWRQLWGDPGSPTVDHATGEEIDVWDELEIELTKGYPHASGAELRIQAVAIDTGGHHAEEVYRYCKPRTARRIFPIKGMGQGGRPLLGRPSKNNAERVKLYPVGTVTAKDLLFSRLKRSEPGPGYIHFPKWIDEEFLAQLTAEKVVTRFHRGRPTRTYEKTRERNEALDLFVYNLAALARLGRAVRSNLGKLAARLNEEEAGGEEARARIRRKRRGKGGGQGGGWVGEWGR